MRIIKKILKIKNKIIKPSKICSSKYYKRYKKYAFIETKCKDARQFEASITKLYHAVEKGLSYTDYRPAFGANNINNLIISLEQYAEKYDTSAFFYKTALCVLNKYVCKNKEYGHEDSQLEKRINKLKGTANDCGGIIEFEPYKTCGDFDYSKFVKSRHSIRCFSSVPVEVSKICEAVELAQFTPSACNRQGWRSRIITDVEAIKTILSNQNGNRGFGEGITSLIIITGDLRCFNGSRELHQVFIDGGMYAMNVLHALHYKELASIPLSASLRDDQEKAVKQAAGIEDYEILIMFIGVGNYPQQCITTRSERRPCEIVKL